MKTIFILLAILLASCGHEVPAIAPQPTAAPTPETLPYSHTRNPSICLGAGCLQ